MPFGELIEQHRVGLALVTLHRERLTSTIVSGVIRHFSKRLVLVEVIGDDGIGRGFSLLRRADLTRVDRATPRLRQIGRVAKALAKNHPTAREVDLLEWRDAILSIRRVAPELTLLREGVGDPFVFESGSIQVTKHLVIGERPDPSPAEEGEVAVALDHITRIDFA